MDELIKRQELSNEILRIYDEHYADTNSQTVHDIFHAVLKRIDKASAVNVHAHWEPRYEIIENDDGWTHNRCSHCKHDAVFYPTFDEDWDEDIDGEWVSLGTFQDGIEEFLTDYCPHCGARMNEVSE